MKFPSPIKTFSARTAACLIFSVAAAVFTKIAQAVEFGCAYYPEAWEEARWEQDLDDMLEIGITAVRIGEFAWGKMEPDEGRFDFSVFDRFLTLCDRKGMRVMMCTPTAAIPQWMHARYPETEKLRADGTRPAAGGRQTACMASPRFRFFARRITERLVEAVKSHPSIDTWQLDNELHMVAGTGVCVCRHCEEGYRAWLKRRYGTLDRLNKAMNGAFWSGDFARWEDIKASIVKARESWRSEYNRYQSDCYIDFAREQRDLVRKGFPEAEILSNGSEMSGWLRLDVLYRELGAVATDTYAAGPDDPLYDRARWMWGLSRGLSGRQRGFTVTETGAFSWSAGDDNADDVIVPWFQDAVRHGATRYFFFRWRQSVNGEQYHPAILPWSGKKGSTYRRVKKLIADHRAKTAAEGETPLPRSGIAVLHSNESDADILVRCSKIQFGPYEDMSIRLNAALGRKGILPDYLMSSPDVDFSPYRVVFVPMNQIMAPETVAGLRRYVAGGGTAVALTRLNCLDPLGGSYMTQSYPVGLTDVFGLEIDEQRAFPWKDFVYDRIEPKGCEVLSRLSKGAFKGSPELTRNRFGRGTAYYRASHLADAADADRLLDALGPVLAAAAVRPAGENAGFTRIVTDGPLPAGARIASQVLSTRAAMRTPPSDAGAALKVSFVKDPSLGGENAKVTVRGGKAVIAASRDRAFFYGVAKLLENIRFGEKTFHIDDVTAAFRPVKRIRCAYWARHFHNWYHMAGAEELKRYAEDMMLMGMNAFDYQYLYPGVNRAGATAEEMAVFAANSKALYGHIRAMDADLLQGGGGNQIPSDSPEEYRAVPQTDEMRGNLGFNACPAKPKALDFMLDLRRKGIETFRREGVAPKYFLHWPFDEGGCECDTCRPWGGNGFIGLCKRYSAMNKAAFPEAKTILSTWVFHDDDYEGLWKYLAKPESEWIDGLMIDAHGDFPKFVLENPLPRKIPIVTFPEISMYKRWPWGGYGAVAMPARFERLFRQCEKVVDGFMFYSEGLYEDINKFLVTRLYSDPSANWRAIMKDYARLFLPGIAPDDFVEFCEMLEESHEFPVADAHLEARPPAPGFFVKYGPRAKEIAAFAAKLENDLVPGLRGDWRWRQIRLRAEIDAYTFNSRKLMTPQYMKMARELIEMYLVDPEEGYYEDYTNHKAVRPYLPDIRLEGRPGETVEYRVRRTNRTERDVVVRPQAKCVPKTFTGEAGVVRPDGSVDWNGSMTLKPGASVMLAGRIRIPADAEEGHYGANVIFPHGRSKGKEYWWISLEVTR